MNIDTIRYYERQGLLEPAARTASGYRKYGPGKGELQDCPIVAALSGERDVAGEIR